MSTWASYTYELSGKNKIRAEKLSDAGCWTLVKEEISDNTKLTEVCTDVLRGDMGRYNNNFESFKVDVKIALLIIEKKYLQLFRSIL